MVLRPETPIIDDDADSIIHTRLGRAPSDDDRVELALLALGNLKRHGLLDRLARNPEEKRLLTVMTALQDAPYEAFGDAVLACQELTRIAEDFLSHEQEPIAYENLRGAQKRMKDGDW